MYTEYLPKVPMISNRALNWQAHCGNHDMAWRSTLMSYSLIVRLGYSKRRAKSLN